MSPMTPSLGASPQMGSSPPRRQEQTIQLELDLGVRGRGAGRHEVDDQPSKPPVRHPSPHPTELSEDAVPPLGVRRLPRSVGWWYGGAHEPEPMRLSTVAACQIGCPPGQRTAPPPPDRAALLPGAPRSRRLESRQKRRKLTEEQLDQMPQIHARSQSPPPQGRRGRELEIREQPGGILSGAWRRGSGAREDGVGSQPYPGAPSGSSPDPGGVRSSAWSGSEDRPKLGGGSASSGLRAHAGVG